MSCARVHGVKAACCNAQMTYTAAYGCGATAWAIRCICEGSRRRLFRQTFDFNVRVSPR